MKNKKIITTLLAGILCIGCSVPAFAGTWKAPKTEDGPWKYINDDGTYASNLWIQENGKWYYINTNRTMTTTYCEYNGKWYAFNKDGSLSTGGWIQADSLGNSRRFTNKQGEVVTDTFFIVDDVLYYTERNGSMALITEKPYKWDFDCKPGFSGKYAFDSKNGYVYLFRGRVVTKDGSPYPLDGEVLKGKTIPVYSSDGTLLRTIQN